MYGAVTFSHVDFAYEKSADRDNTEKKAAIGQDNANRQENADHKLHTRVVMPLPRVVVFLPRVVMPLPRVVVFLPRVKDNVGCSCYSEDEKQKINKPGKQLVAKNCNRLKKA